MERALGHDTFQASASVLVTALVFIVPFSPAVATSSAANGAFYVALAVRIDYAELPAGQSFSNLLAEYPFNTWKPRVAYAAPALLALAGIFQQLYAGDVSGAGRDIFTSLRLLIPNMPTGN